MSAIGLLLLAVFFAVPVGWLVSEFWNNRLLRVALGILAIVTTTWGVCMVDAMLTRFNYNAWYGHATKDLIETSLQQAEDGHLDRVLKVWRGLRSQYQPTYENRAGYRELVEAATARMRGDVPIKPGSVWDATVFNEKTWLGHWEDDTGFWLVVDGLGPRLTVFRSGDPPLQMHSVSVSDDFRVLKFKEGEQWTHTLTLKNKYEASHEWFDARKQSVWRTDTLHKLIRATDEQKRMTEQSDSRGAAPPARKPDIGRREQL